MKTLTHYRLLIAAAALSLLITNPLFARPIGFSELSLMVRMHQSEADIRSDVTERKLLHPLTQPQEGILKTQGASDALIKSLHDSNLVASKKKRPRPNHRLRTKSMGLPARRKIIIRGLMFLKWRLAIQSI